MKTKNKAMTQLLELAGGSTKTLSQKLGVNHTTVQTWYFRHKITPKYAFQAEDMFGVSARQLMGFPEKKVDDEF